MRTRLVSLLVVASLGCTQDDGQVDTGEARGDSEVTGRDAGFNGSPDARASDAEAFDAGANAIRDVDTVEVGTFDSTVADAPAADATRGVGVDAVAPDAEAPDAELVDTGPPADGGPVDMFAVEMDRNFTNIDGEDEITIICDDAVAGAGGHQLCDVGAGSFTYEVWLRGDAASNPNTSGVGMDVDQANYQWIVGNIFLDRDIFGGSCDGRDFGASVVDGRVSFGVGATLSGSGPLTVYGSTPVVETPAVWRHVALVHDDPAGRLRIFVDGVLDVESTSLLPSADRSIPDEGCSQGSASSAARQVELAIGTEKHGFGTISFDGRIARVRIWDVARTAPEILAGWSQVVPCQTAGLVARYDLDEGAGSVGTDACGGSPNAIVSLGSRGLTRWVVDGPALSP